jgi:hypothetical protein
VNIHPSHHLVWRPTKERQQKQSKQHDLGDPNKPTTRRY